MANFIAVIDADFDRRGRYLRQVEPALAFLDGLRTARLCVGDLAVAWAASPRAPVSVARAGDAAAVIWGDAIPGSGPERLSAAELLTSWDPRRDAAPVFDGYHVALRYDAGHGLAVGADVLGLFPVYYAVAGPVVLAGSSPRLIHAHPLVRGDFSIEGLLGLLLTNALLDGRTLTRDVRRLLPGRRLVHAGGNGYVEQAHYTIPAMTEAGGTFEDHVALLDRTFTEVIARHVPPAATIGILLSGGRDSRMIAGTLDRLGLKADALTLGGRGDYEAACARHVARALDYQHRVVDIEPGDFAGFATTQARWEQLGTGFSNVHTWSAIEPLRALPDRFLTGYVRESRESGDPPAGFDAFWSSAAHHGLGTDFLSSLLRPHLRDAIAETFDVVRDVYESMSDRVSERTWRFLLAHDHRTHAGGVPWRLSFGSWPVLPILDRRLLEVLAMLPSSTLAHRRAQDALLRTRFPRLARLPLDRNTHDTEPLIPSLARRLSRPARQSLRRALRSLPVPGSERRYYYRMYDIDGPGWRAIRDIAEPYRSRLTEWFDPAALDRFVPPPPLRMNLPHTIRDGFGRKLALGLMLRASDGGG